MLMKKQMRHPPFLCVVKPKIQEKFYRGDSASGDELDTAAVFSCKMLF